MLRLSIGLKPFEKSTFNLLLTLPLSPLWGRGLILDIMKKTIEKTVNLDLAGHDGNAFALMGVFQRQAKRENWTPEEIDAVMEEAKSDNYDHLLQTLILHCEPKDGEDDKETQNSDHG